MNCCSFCTTWFQATRTPSLQMILRDFQCEQSYMHQQRYQETLHPIQKDANNTPVCTQSFTMTCQIEVPAQREGHVQDNLHYFMVRYLAKTWPCIIDLGLEPNLLNHTGARLWSTKTYAKQAQSYQSSSDRGESLAHKQRIQLSVFKAHMHSWIFYFHFRCQYSAIWLSLRHFFCGFFGF